MLGFEGTENFLRIAGMRGSGGISMLIFSEVRGGNGIIMLVFGGERGHWY